MKETKKQKPTYENLNVYKALMQEYYDCTTDDLDVHAELAAKAQQYYDQFDWFCYTFEENGKVGLKDAMGRVMVAAKYDEILNFPAYIYLCSVPVKAVKDGKIGILQLSYEGEAQEVSAFEFEDAYAIEFTSFTAVRKPGSDKWGLIDLNGEMLIPTEMDKIYPSCSNGNIFVEKDGKEGVYDYMYDGFAYPVYDSIDGMGDGGPLTFVKDGVEGHVDVEGKFYSFETLERFYEGEKYDVDGSLIFEGEDEDDEPLFLTDHLD